MADLKRGYCLVALAGFGREIIQIKKRLTVKFEQSCRFVGRNMELSGGIPVYKRNHLGDLLDDILRYAFPYSSDPKGFCTPSHRRCGASGESGLGPACDLSDGKRACRDLCPGSILVVLRKGVNDALMENALSACVYLHKSDGVLNEGNIAEIVERHQEIYDDILHKEVYGATKRTPVLLPIRNFQEDSTAALISSLHHHPPDAGDAIEKFRSRWFDPTYRHPRGGRPGAFLDSRKIGFSKDPKFHDRRVAPSADRVQSALRLLNAFYRLGILFETGFHYDVCRQRRTKPLSLNAYFWDSAKEKKEYRTEEYINIAPDDQIRK